jgi:hypothetical protein
VTVRKITQKAGGKANIEPVCETTLTVKAAILSEGIFSTKLYSMNLFIKGRKLFVIAFRLK